MISAHGTSRLTSSRALGLPRSSVIPFFEVLKLAKNWLRLIPGIASFHGGPILSTSGRAADSTLITSAPLSARYLVVIGPTPTQAKSRTWTPSNAKRLIRWHPRRVALRLGRARVRAVRDRFRHCARRLA